jgi:hypothetical protein
VCYCRLRIPNDASGAEPVVREYTLIATAKINDIDPRAWLADILARLPEPFHQAHPRVAALELAPGNYRR